MWLGGSDVMDDAKFFVDNGIRAVVSICETHPMNDVIKAAKLSVIQVQLQDSPSSNLLLFFARAVHFIQAARTGHLKETKGHLEKLSGPTFYKYSPRGISPYSNMHETGSSNNKGMWTDHREKISEAEAELEESLAPLQKRCFSSHAALQGEALIKPKILNCCFCIPAKDDNSEPTKIGNKDTDSVTTSNKLMENQKLNFQDSTMEETSAGKLYANGKYIPPTGVYIHCQAGISRSTTTFCSYLIVWLGFNMKQSLGHLHRCRGCVCPNQGFRQQLRLFELRKEYVAILKKSIVTKFCECPELLQKDLNHVALIMAQTAEQDIGNWNTSSEDQYEQFGTQDFDLQERLLREQLRVHIKDVEEGKISQNVGLQWLFSKEDLAK